MHILLVDWNLNLCPSGWGQPHPCGLLDPAGRCGVRSDASLAAGLLSKEAVAVSYSPWSCYSVVASCCYLLNSELNQGRCNTASGHLVGEDVSIFLNSLVQWSREKESVSTLICFNGCFGLSDAKLWIASLSHTLSGYMCEFVRAPQPCVAWLLKGDITKIGH